ncbi:hypothetical protein MKK70_27830 [Methylobacterium sp. E-041]|jgi:hypothetical protein|uniref:hypothetical protein n=1 Tax=Methylobacterium sp. E-041 TaxID=2836573 RepID=UPI001FB9EE8C|nr:hypothetical protein [Methylobacterium sp. E-041]MCJ2109112.1 hypothetical protein [Methylobacterium sp. E-041]
MSSISSTTASQIQAPQRPAHAHKNRVASEIDSEASAGTISATDATALTSALDSIDASLKSGETANGAASASSSTSAASRLDPSQIKSRIDGLIADQVTNGTLTSDQAATLTSLFAKGGAKGEAKDGGVGGAGGPPPGPPFGAAPDGNDLSDASSADPDASASGSTSTASTSDLLASFIKQLQSTQASATGYASSGTSSTSSNASALVLDFRS